MELLKRLLGEEDGQSVTEYILIVAMISIIAISMMQIVGSSVNSLWNNVAGEMPD